MMDISLQRFGPIESGTIRLRPLTVFIGPNNSGKSYSAMVAYAAMLAASPLMGHPYGEGIQSPAQITFARNSMSRPIKAATMEQIGDILREWFERASPVGNPPAVPTSDELLQWVRETVSLTLNEYVRALSGELARCFGTRLSQLRRRNGEATVSVIEVRNSAPTWGVRLEAGSSKRQFLVTEEPDPAAILLTASRRLVERIEGYRSLRLPSSILAEEMRRLIVAGCFDGSPRGRYYMPAARSGILHSHRLLASIVVSRAPLAGIETMEIPRMTGVIADFIGLLLQLGPGEDRTTFDATARYLEEMILGGDVEIRGRPPEYPEITYRLGDLRLALHRTSSMISDLAPVVLFLRYRLAAGDLLVFEEPEAHLHPRSQLLLARGVAQLVNAGINMLLTTHSDYFLAQINNILRASALDRSVAQERGFGLGDLIKPSNVAAYLFRPGQAHRGTDIRRIPVTSRNGISDKEFATVNESLYAESVSLQRQLLRTESH